MKRIIIMLLIACSAVVTATAQSKSKTQKKDYLAIVENKEYQYPLRVFRRLREIRDQFGRKQGQVYSVLKNPNTGLIESAERITHFSCDVKELKTIDQVFMDDEPYSYQILHIMPGSREQFSIRVVSNGGQPNNTLHVRTNSKQEMWFLATKNLENPQLRDAYAIVWEPSADGLNVEGTVYGISSLRPDLYTKNLETSNNVFRIDGRVGDDLTDSLYVVYMADSSEELDKLADDAFMEYMPVVNRRFSFSVEIDKPKVGRIRTVMPDGSLCHLWTNLDFVPGETYHITTHNGYYDEDRDYERRVGRYSGKSLLNKRQVRGIDDVANVDDADDASAHDRPFPEPSPALKLRMEIKYKELGAKTETVRAFYKSLDPKSNASWARKDRIFDRIIKQNQEVDAVFRDLQKLFKDYFKEFDNLVDKRAEILGPGYEGILEFYTEQNKSLTEMMSSGIQLPKSAQKTQKALNKYIEKYMKEMTKLAMEVE
ncbi:MAG: hypothetical protein J6Y33_05310 [Prevotella sp.]|nr:hypothetical protein [Prevotella sp.]